MRFVVVTIATLPLPLPISPRLFSLSTKYLAGHTDLVGGAVSYATPELGAQLAHYQLLLGACMVSRCEGGRVEHS